MADLVQYYGTGRRKRAVARVFLRPGSGDFKVNGLAFDKYFVTESQRVNAKQPLVSTESAASFNVLANVSGGGVSGQADAVKLGIARADWSVAMPAAKSARSTVRRAQGSASSSASGSLGTAGSSTVLPIRERIEMLARNDSVLGFS